MLLRVSSLVRLGCMFAGLMFAAEACAADRSTPRPPNIVIILADDLGYGDVGCYGARLVQTPQIDRLAAQGRKFTDAHTPSSVCTPTRYGMLTGRYCWRTSLQRETLPPLAPLLIEPTRTTIASYLKQQGYQTAAIGKWHLGYGTAVRADFDKPLRPGPLDVGFDYHFGVPQNHGDFLRCYVEGDQVIGRRAGEPFQPQGPGKPPLGLASPRLDDTCDRVLTEKAVAWLERAEGPFFLYFAPVAVHAPVTPHKDVRGTSKCGLYGDYIHELDWCVGQILSALDKRGAADDTLVIFTSDNGGVAVTQESREQLLTLADDADGSVARGCRTAWRDALAAGHAMNGPWRGRKASIYEGGSRVPFIARWPGQIPPGTSSDELICLTDLLATVATIVGRPLPNDAGEDSYDISVALRGAATGTPIREALVTQNVEGVTAIRQGRWKYVAAGHAPDSPKGSQMAKEGNEPQLYDLNDDPAETTNVLAQHKQIGDRLAALLAKYRAEGHSRPAPGR